MVHFRFVRSERQRNEELWLRNERNDIAGIMINSSLEMTSERFVRRIVKNACSGVNWLMKRFLVPSRVICFWASSKRLLNVIFDTFFYQRVEKATDNKTFGFGLSCAEIHLRRWKTETRFHTHQFKKTIISISLDVYFIPHKRLSSSEINFYTFFC